LQFFTEMERFQNALINRRGGRQATTQSWKIFPASAAPVIWRTQMRLELRMKQLGVVLVGAALAWLVLWA
jgi:hypothetical protein